MSDADEEKLKVEQRKQQRQREEENGDQANWTGWLGSKPWWQEEEEEAVTTTEGTVAFARSSSGFENPCGVNGLDEAGELCELAPHSEMNVGAGRVDSPSPQDIRLLHDLVEDLSKEQDEQNSKPKTEQVTLRRYASMPRGGVVKVFPSASASRSSQEA